MTDRASAMAARLKAQADEQRRRREEAADEAERTRVPDRIRPTRQTEQRLQPDPVSVLFERGSITAPQRDAAFEIRQAYYEAASVVMARSARWDGERISSRTFTDEATTGQIARRQRYRRWADSPRMRMNSAYLVAIDIVVDGRGVREIERESRWRNGRATTLLVDALSHYAQLAGWETRV